MRDLIDRQAAIDAVRIDNLHEGIVAALQSVLRDLPSAEPERKTGKWLRPRPAPQVWSLFMADCSVCGKITYMGDYCMECGAKMEDDDEV